MSKLKRGRRKALRMIDVLFERVGVRPFSLFVFCAAIVGLLALELDTSSAIQARGVAYAPSIEHTAQTRSFVEAVHVREGQLIEVGTPLVTLSSRFIERDLERMDAEILKLEKETLLEQAQLLVDDKRERDALKEKIDRATRDRAVARADEREGKSLISLAQTRLTAAQDRAEKKLARATEALDAEHALGETSASAQAARDAARAELALLNGLQARLEQRPDQPVLESATLELKQAELAVLRKRREALLRDREHLVIKANGPGRISRVASVGSAADVGMSVATLYPPQAQELIIYVPADTPLGSIKKGSVVHFRPDQGCRDHGQVVRVGARVQEAPPQLVNFFRFAVHGLPVYATIPEGCELAVGQLLDVELMRSSKP